MDRSIMNQRWETYITTHKKVGKQSLKEYIKEHALDLERVLDIAAIEKKYELAYLADEIIKLKTEVARIKKLTKKVLDDE